MDHRGYVSTVPRTDRAGYTGPLRGYLESKQEGVWLVIVQPSGAFKAVRPGKFSVLVPYGTNIWPKSGVRNVSGEWVIQPDDVVVDYLTGYESLPIVLGSVAREPGEFLDAAEGVAARFPVLDTTTGEETGYVQAEAHGTLTVTASDAMTLESEKANVVLATPAGDVCLSEAEPADFAARADRVDDDFTRLKNTLNAWVPTGTLADATTLKTALTALFNTGWPSATKADKVKIT